MCCLVLVVLFYWYQRNDLMKMIHAPHASPANSRSMTMDTSPYHTPQSGHSSHSLHTSEGSMPTLPAIPSLHPVASVHTTKTKTTLPSIPRSMDEVDHLEDHKHSKTSHLSVAMPWDVLFQKNQSEPKSPVQHSPIGIDRISPASVPYHPHRYDGNGNSNTSHRHRRHVTAGNQRYAAIPTTNMNTMPELNENNMDTPMSPNLPPISPMANTGNNGGNNGVIVTHGHGPGAVTAVASVPPPAAFHDLPLQRHHSHHAMGYPHPAFASHSVPPNRGGVSRRDRTQSMQIGRRHSNRNSIVNHINLNQHRESVHTLSNIQHHIDHNKFNPLRNHRTSESFVNHNHNHNAIGHRVQFEEEEVVNEAVNALRDGTINKPMEVMTVINTEARTVLSDVTSSSSGESTDHADDDQFDSVSTRMKSERKFGRRKHRKHRKHNNRSSKHKMEKYKAERLQGVLEEEVVEELNALKKSEVSVGFQPSRKNTEFSEDRYVD